MKDHPHVDYRNLSIYTTYGFLQKYKFDFFDDFLKQNPHIHLNLIEYLDKALDMLFDLNQINIGFMNAPYYKDEIIIKDIKNHSFKRDIYFVEKNNTTLSLEEELFKEYILSK